jgi:hypothetical protein
MISPIEPVIHSVNQALMYSPPGSIETYNGPEFGVWSVYSLNVPLLGKKTKTLFVAYSVPTTTVDPANDVTAKP